MTTSQTPLMRALSPSENLRSGDKAYFCAQQQHDLHQVLMDTFVKCQREYGLKQSDLARRSGHSPAVVSRSLTDPSNYESNTVAVLMAAMGHKLCFHAEKLAESGSRNYVPALQQTIEGCFSGNVSVVPSTRTSSAVNILVSNVAGKVTLPVAGI